MSHLPPHIANAVTRALQVLRAVSDELALEPWQLLVSGVDPDEPPELMSDATRRELVRLRTQPSSEDAVRAFAIRVLVLAKVKARGNQEAKALLRQPPVPVTPARRRRAPRPPA